MSDEQPETIIIMRDQGVKLLAIVLALRAGDIAIRGHEDEDVENAVAALNDLGEECALQLGGLGG